MIVLEVTYQGRTRKISADRDSLAIGRGRSCVLRIADPKVGESHCTLTREMTRRTGIRGKKWILRLQDHQVSDVPTLVNGIEVIKTHIERGDLIQIGDMSIRVVDPGSPRATQNQAPKSTASGTVAPALPPLTIPRTLQVDIPVRPPALAAASDTAQHFPTAHRPARTPPRGGPTRRSRPVAVDPEQASPGVNRTLGWLVTGMAAAMVVLVLLITRGPGDRSAGSRKSGPVADRTRERTDLGTSRKHVFEDKGIPASRLAEDRAGGASGLDMDVSPATASPLPAGSGGGRPTGRTPTGAVPGRMPKTGEAMTKREIYLEALRADRMARENDFKTAADVYRDLATRTLLERLAAELKDRVTHLDRLKEARIRLSQCLAGLADSDTLKPEIPCRGSLRRVLGGRENQGILVHMSGEVMLPWKNVPCRAMETLLRWAHPGAEGQVVNGLYLFEFKADFEKNPGLEERCHACFQKALKQAPDRIQEVNAILGRGLGVTSPTGFVFHNRRFMTPERRDRLVMLAEARKQMSNLTSARAEVRRTAYDYLRTVPDLEMYQLFRRVLEARRRTLARQLQDSPTGKKIKALREDKSKFLARREAMLKAIFDTFEYPYPYSPGRGASQEEYQRYLASQNKIDAGVKVLQKIWKSTRGQLTFGKAFTVGYGLLQEVQGELDRFKGDEVEPAEGFGELTALGDITFFKEACKGKVILATLPMDRKERHRVEYNHRVMKYNEKLDSPATKTEKQQVCITNDYRNLMGRKALMLHNKLLDSARGHSRDMVLKGYFSHTAPDPERRTPRHRMKLAGYNLTGGSENIARGASGPASVHDRWFHSSGHHRNLLNKNWREMGSGNVGSFWTQNFGTRGKDLYDVLEMRPGTEKDAKDPSKKKPANVR